MRDIIGISAYYHDSSVALVRDGRLIAFVKEESLTRIKGINAFPIHAIKFLIKKFDITPTSLKHICFYEKPLKGWVSLMHHALERPFSRWRQAVNQLRSFWDGPLFLRHELQQIFPNWNFSLIYSHHHLSHALTALAYAGETDEWTAIVVDGVGDGHTASIFHIEGNSVKRLWYSKFPFSIGLFYSTITDFIGFPINEGEFKVMALAAFGKPVHIEFMRKNMLNFQNGRIYGNLKFYDYHRNPESSFSSHLVDQLGPEGDPKTLDLAEHSKEFLRLADIAASAQTLLSDILKQIVLYAIEMTGCKRVLISGGVAQNCRAIADLVAIEELEELIVPPSPGDSGAAIGAAFYATLLDGVEQPRWANLFPGCDGRKSAVSNSLFEKVYGNDEKISKAVNLIGKGEIIGTFLGNGECGPRALGHRSLLCDATNDQVLTTLNIKIKKREPFRPLSPMMLESSAKLYFEINPNAKKSYRWMGLTSVARSIAYKFIPSVLHIDGTARIQIVDEGQGSVYQLLLESEQNEMPALANTSFNISGDPIVFDHLDCYINMKRLGVKWILMDDGLFRILNV